jgi:hypothetical protein
MSDDPPSKTWRDLIDLKDVRQRTVTQLLVTVIVSIVAGFAVLVWNLTGQGGIIRALGGASQLELESTVKRLVELESTVKRLATPGPQGEKVACVPYSSRTGVSAKIVLPWRPSSAQTQKGVQIGTKITELGADRQPPNPPPTPQSEAPTDTNEIRYYFQSDAGFADILKNQLQPLLSRAIERVPLERGRLTGEFNACPGDIEFWMSSQE